jgi:pilus assembly protein TadC
MRMQMPARAAYLAITALVVAGCGGAKTLVFRDDGIEFSYPRAWSVSGFSRAVSPARLVISSYRVTRGEVEGDCGGSRALAALPRIRSHRP